MTRAGDYIKNMAGEMEYMSFKPAPLTGFMPFAFDEETAALIVSANRVLAKLDSAAEHIANIDLFVSMYVRKEALMSSQMEGTQCTLEDILDPGIEENANADVSDVVNYVKATQFALTRLEELPICCRLMRETHAVLMEGVRGKEKDPGQFRRSQNWIGPAGSTLKTARYIPPNVEDMDAALSDLEQYINSGDNNDPLVRVALIHYQFETIHPFLDGNGRIGRLLILLYLIEQKLLSKPVIYVSYFLKRNQIEYYDRMSEVRRSGNYEQWVKFFLEAVENAAEDALTSINKLAALHEKNVELLPKTTRTRDNIRALFEYVEHHPIIDIKQTAQALGVSYNTASSAVKKLMECGVLSESSNRARSRVFVYNEYLEILKDGT